MIFQDKPRKFLLITAGDTLIYEGVDTTRLTEQKLNDYSGIYYSDETESKIKLLVKDGKVLMKGNRGDSVTLKPIYKDGFSFPLAGASMQGWLKAWRTCAI